MSSSPSLFRFITLGWLLVVPAFAQQAPATLAPARVEAIDAAVRRLMERDDAVGVAVGVVEQGEVVCLRAYGSADREANRPADLGTVFNWASNSKPVVAAAALQLVEQGKLDLDADVRRYVPEFPDKGVKITARQILCHQSGIPHYDKVVPLKKEYDVELPFLSPVVALDTFSPSPLLFEPGTNSTYSTFAYILLSAVVERAGGQPLFRQLDERIIKPLGMASFEEDVPGGDLAKWATGYGKKGGKATPLPMEHHYWKHGGGGYRSDIGSFARWARGLATGKVLKPETEALAWRLQKAGAERPYGLGVMVDREAKPRQISHNGRQEKVLTRLVVWPDEHKAVVVMTNSNYIKVKDVADAVNAALAPLSKL